MIRVVIENFLLFLLPTIAYISWAMITRGETSEDGTTGRPSPSQVISDAPLIWLFFAGTVMVIATLVMFGSTTGNSPNEDYKPPVIKDGHITPGEFK